MCDKRNYGMEFNAGVSFGFLLAEAFNVEFYLAALYNAPDVSEDVWEYGHLWLPLAARFSYEVLRGGYAILEVRVALDLGEVDDPDPDPFADMFIGYRHELGDFLVGGGIFFALNNHDTTGRYKAGLSLSARYRFL